MSKVNEKNSYWLITTGHWEDTTKVNEETSMVWTEDPVIHFVNRVKRDRDTYKEDIDRMAETSEPFLAGTFYRTVLLNIEKVSLEVARIWPEAIVDSRGNIHVPPQTDKE